MTAATKPAEPTKPDGLHVKMARVLGAVHGVAKEGEVKGKGGGTMFRYVTAATVYDEIRPRLAAEGIAAYFSSRVSDDGRLLLGSLTFVDGETGETYAIEGVGIVPTGDAMVTYKAMTSLHRHLLLKQFMLSDGEEVEAGAGQAPRLAVAPTQRQAPPPDPARSALMALTDDEKARLKVMARDVLGIDRDPKAAEYPQVLADPGKPTTDAYRSALAQYASMQPTNGEVNGDPVPF